MSDLSRGYGLVLDPWQEEVLKAGLGERSDGNWAARQVGVSTPRQNGKTQIIVARVLAGLVLFNEERIIVSAHRQDTSREVFLRLAQIIDDNPSLKARTKVIARSITREYIEMKNGCMVQFKSRVNGSGRGFSCDCLILDEAQDMSSESWSSTLPTMSARPNPQVWLFGTPPTEGDDGEVFGRIREAGVTKRGSGIAYLEWSASEGADPDRPATWAEANPAYGIRIRREAIEGERATMSEEQFWRERLGRWDSIMSANKVIPLDSWTDQTDTLSLPVSNLTLAFEVAPDKVRTSLALAGLRGDGATWHVELYDQKDGTDWLVPLVKEYLRLNPQIIGVIADAGSPSQVLFPALQEAGVIVTTPKVQDLGIACSSYLSGIVTGTVFHTGQPQVNTAAQMAGKRPLGNTGMWVWSRKNVTSDITPIQAQTLALWGAQNATNRHAVVRKPEAKKRRIMVHD